MLPLSENVYVACVGFTRRPSPGGVLAIPVFPCSLPCRRRENERRIRLVMFTCTDDTQDCWRASRVPPTAKRQNVISAPQKDNLTLHTRRNESKNQKTDYRITAGPRTKTTGLQDGLQEQPLTPQRFNPYGLQENPRMTAETATCPDSRATTQPPAHEHAAPAAHPLSFSIFLLYFLRKREKKIQGKTVISTNKHGLPPDYGRREK